MAKKIFIVSTVLVMALSGLAFANGQKDATVPAASEKVTLTGNVYLEGELHPLLKSGGKEYELMVPPYLVTQIDIKEGAEIKVLELYLPQRLSADEVAAEVAAIVASLGASGPGDMGKVMGAAKAQLAGKADMASVSAAVKQALSK